MHRLNGDPGRVARELQDFIGLGVRRSMLGFTDFPSQEGLGESPARCCRICSFRSWRTDTVKPAQ